MNEIEKIRAQSLKRNADFLGSLGLSQFKRCKLKPKKLETQPKKKNKVQETSQTRKSARLKSGVPQSYSEKHVQLNTFFDDNNLYSLPTRKKLVHGLTKEEILDEGPVEKTFWEKMTETPVLHSSFKDTPAVASLGNWQLVAVGHAADGFFGRVAKGHVKATGAKVYYGPYSTTCHWCRQKTVDLKTRCSLCHGHFADGVLCGACLFNRYNENILDAINDPDWICPCCLDECNCSFCLPGRKNVKCTGQMSRTVAEESLTVNQWLRKYKHVQFGEEHLLHPGVHQKAKKLGINVGAFLQQYHQSRGTLQGRHGNI